VTFSDRWKSYTAGIRQGVGGTLLLLLALLPRVVIAQDFAGFDDFLGRYKASGVEVSALTRSFTEWQRERGGFPIVTADGGVVFVYFGTGKETDVRLTGDFHPRSFFDVYWDPAGEAMERVGSMFYARRTFESDARLDYAFMVDGKSTPDPLNPRTLFSGTGNGTVSELVLPGHRLPTDAIARSGVPQGTLEVVGEPWAIPKVTVYMPPAYESTKTYPTLYTADGSAWVDLIRLPAILDNLIAAHAIEPVMAVMIDAAKDRTAWYSYNPEYLTYLQRVVTYVDRRYATRPSADARLHAGTSAGGRASMYVGFEMPAVFHNVALLSPSLTAPLYYYEPYFSGRLRPDATLRVWLSAGTYEGSIH
jgi:hypothetical protein